MTTLLVTALKKNAAKTALVAGMGAAMVGAGAGVASAAPQAGPGMFPQDHHGWGGGDDWHGHGRGRGWGGPGWQGPGWGGPGWGPGPGVYIAPPCATGPLGFVTVCG